MYKFVLPDMPREKSVLAQKDLKTAYLLKKAFVGAHGELNSAVKFIYCFYSLSQKQKYREAEIMLSIAVDEMKHFQRLGKLIDSLVVDLVYTAYPPIDFSNCKISCLDYPLRKTVTDCVSLKLTSIKCYEKTLDKIDNNYAEKIVKDILEKEKIHLDILESLLKKH